VDQDQLIVESCTEEGFVVTGLLADIINKVSDLVNELVAGLSEFGALHFDGAFLSRKHRQFLNIYTILVNCRRPALT
jgi:hypothetical protein